ncbi:MAG: hypothetical protein ABIJ09_13930 [Pseudomonadota bacterium]
MSDPRHPDDGEPGDLPEQTEASSPLDPKAADPAPGLVRPASEGPADIIEAMKYQQVVVRANAITYQGMLLGADEEEVYLKTNTRYVTVRMDRITKISLAGSRDGLNPLKQVDPAFYSVDDIEPTDAD